MITIKDSKQVLAYHSHYSCFFLLDLKEEEALCMRSCREEFYSYWNQQAMEAYKTSPKYVGYLHSSINLAEIRRFWGVIEQRLGVKDVFHDTDKANAILVEYDSFWFQNPVRRSFFTLFLRCAVCYAAGKTFVEALRSYELSNLIPDAINHFLEGNTTPVFEGVGKGVVETFRNTSKDWISSNLVAYYPVTK